MAERIPVAVLGATGSVGQRFVQLLDQHPWFEVRTLTGSDRKTGQKYSQACHWVLSEPMPDWARDLPVLASDPRQIQLPLVFSALPPGVAREVEPDFARAGSLVCSNASAFRPAPDVPILLPEVNPGHLQILDVQRAKRGWSGGIVTNSNCTSTGMTVALKALQDAFGLRQVFAVSMQAISGAGYPGVPAMDIMDNVIPYIEGEEEKVEWESRKILGELTGGELRLADFSVSAHTNRVAVSDGHMVCLSLSLGQKASYEEVHQALETYCVPDAAAGLPSTPEPVILVKSEQNRPQPRLDRMTGKGMTTIVGRLRPDPLMDWKLVVLSHNTIRGAAGGSIYNAELLKNGGWIR